MIRIISCSIFLLFDSTTLALHNLQFKIILSFYATFISALQLIYTVNKTI